MKIGDENLLTHGKFQEAAISFDEEYEDGTQNDKRRRGCKHNLCMKGNPKRWGSSEPTFGNFFQDDKTDSPQDDQRGNGEINEDVVLKTHEAIGEQGETGIAECRYGMEEGIIERGH